MRGARPASATALPVTDRPFFFFTLKGRGLAPPGLAYTIETDDIGAWSIVDGTLARQ